ncbi:hypothetical protein DPMN_060088 [Dreissena polymorpha]|uniref:Uncharacterized protein n=1 Tax=Dreissena polymorpha TaxID=45954 RepID=A0A9D4HFJ5_DREPO|nr:hypothetical protein DPMN_060088 [Dreissena polymorpha]
MKYEDRKQLFHTARHRGKKLRKDHLSNEKDVLIKYSHGNDKTYSEKQEHRITGATLGYKCSFE